MAASLDASLGSPPAKRVTGVDGIRGWLAFYVMVAHLVNAYGSGVMISGANLSVKIFFVISGYVLTRSWNGNFPGFLVRRFFRLWPVYALSLAVGGWMIAKAPPASFFFWFPFETDPDRIPYNPVMWSLFVEAWSALFMPLIVGIGRRPTFAAVSIVVLMLAQLVDRDLSWGAYFVTGAYMAKYTLDAKYFADPVSQGLGKISYSLYLTHLLVIAACKFHLPGIALYLAIPASLAVATLVWFCVERPSILLSRWFGRRADRLASAAAREWRRRLGGSAAVPA